MTGSSFSVATTAFISLAICAIISYGVFYYFKQRLSLIEQSQMEQARIMQAIISRGLLQQQYPSHPPNAESSQQQCHKEITITQNSLIEVSSDEESSTDSESESSDTESESGSESGSSHDKWSIGDEIHQTDAYHNEFNEMCENRRASSEKKQIHIDNVENVENIENIENIDIENIGTNENNENDTNTKKIISLKTNAVNADSDDDDDDNDDDSSSSDSEEQPQKFEVKIGYKPAAASNNKSAVHLNYGNMSVSALRQLAKERGLGGDDADLQKLKKKDLVQLLQ